MGLTRAAIHPEQPGIEVRLEDPRNVGRSLADWACYADQARRLREKSNTEEELASYYPVHAVNNSKQYPAPYPKAKHLVGYHS
ncbi:MAG: hypothetical protein ABSG32_12570 [Terriglobia bacterium]